MSRIGFSRWKWFCAPALLAGAPSLALAASHAVEVMSYTPGTAAAIFQTPAAALGAPDGISGENSAATNWFGFPNVLSPFSPAYQGDEVVQIGEGGQLTLRLANFVNVGAGKRLGVLSTAGLGDSNYPSGQNYASASAFAFGGGSARVEVSQDNHIWKDLGVVTFNMPGLFYVNAGPYDGAGPASPQLTDFAKPFEGTLASFDGKDFAGTVAAFAASGGGFSGGGTWLDLSTSGLPQVGYVQFLVADDGNPLTDNRFSVDAVTIANGAVGASTPEPSALAWVGVGAMLVLRRKAR